MIADGLKDSGKGWVFCLCCIYQALDHFYPFTLFALIFVLVGFRSPAFG